MWGNENPCALLVQPLWMENTTEVSQKLKIELPYDLAILLLSIQPKEMKTEYEKDICTPTFIAALFTIGWKQPKCSSMNQSINIFFARVCVCVSALKEGELVICDNMDEIRGVCAK